MADTITKSQIKIVFSAMLAAGIAIVLFGIFVPGLLGLGENGVLLRWMAFAGGAIGIVMAFVLRAIFLKHLPPSERNAGTIQRQ